MSAAGTVPSREDWPDPPPQTEAGAALTDVISATSGSTAGSWTSPSDAPEQAT